MPMSYEPVRIAGSVTIYATIDEIWIERPFGTLHGVPLINFERVAVWRLSDQHCWFVDLEPETLRRRRLSQVENRADPAVPTQPMPDEARERTKQY